MGMEAVCTITHRRAKYDQAKAMLEGDHIVVRSPDIRLKVMFSDLQKVEASTRGVLTLDFTDGPLLLDLGTAALAEKWANKILHPPTRMDKLGLKPGMSVFTDGEFDRQFHNELMGVPSKPASEADVLLVVTESKPGLKRAVDAARKMQPKAGIWVVYPKGVTTIRQEDVFEAMRGAGFVDTKVCGFSASHTALRFAVPMARRPKPVK